MGRERDLKTGRERQRERSLLEERQKFIGRERERESSLEEREREVYWKRERFQDSAEF
jgi:hypothetical protein